MNSDQELFFKFFRLISRFEASIRLLNERYRKLRGQVVVGTDFSAYANDRETDLAKCVKVTAAAEALIKLKPRELVQSDGNELKFNWLEPEESKMIVKAIKLAFRVRNNLFHGSKSIPDSSYTRDPEIVKAAEILIVRILDADSTLKAKFDELLP